MVHLDASEIAELISQGLASDEITGVRVLDYPVDSKRRKYPMVEVINVQPSGREADPRTTTISQKFTVNLYVRKRGAGSNEITQIKQIEDSILVKLDNSTLGSGTLFVENKSWTRSATVVDQPIPHYESSLSVLVTEVTSTTGSGKIGGDMLLTLPGLTDMPILSKPVERESEGQEDIKDDTLTRVRVAPTGDTRTFYAEVEYTETRMTTMRTLKNAHSKIAVSINRGGTVENFNGYLQEMSHGAGYSEIETIVLRIEVVP